jgi:hypothetical protein
MGECTMNDTAPRPAARYRKALVVGASIAAAVMSTVVILPSEAATTNLIANASFETAGGSAPSGWSKDSWGSNTATFSYPSTGAQHGTRYASVKVAGRAGGDAKWAFAPVAVSPNATYTFSDWYRSTVATEIDIEIQDAAGNYSYLWVAGVGASSAWKQSSVTFTTPAKAARMTVMHVIAANGTLDTDNESLTAGTAPTLSPTATATPTATTVSPTPTGTPTVTPKPTVTPTSTPTVTPTGMPTSTPTPPPPPPPAGNDVPNPSAETATGTAPASWRGNSWGTGTATFAYLSTGHTGSRSLKVTVTGRSNGDAKWVYDAKPVTSASTYRYTDWYQSDVGTEIDAEVTMTDGSTQYLYLGSLPASASWAQAGFDVTMPAQHRRPRPL